MGIETPVLTLARRHFTSPEMPLLNLHPISCYTDLVQTHRTNLGTYCGLNQHKIGKKCLSKETLASYGHICKTLLLNSNINFIDANLTYLRASRGTGGHYALQQAALLHEEVEPEMAPEE